MVSMQLELFDVAEEVPISRVDKVSGFQWSHSKYSIKEQCHKRYYYIYYGANKRVALNEPAKKRLQFLKKRVQTRHLLAGEVLHTVIKTFFTKAQGGEIYSLERMIDFARMLFRQGWDYSRRYHTDATYSNDKYPPPILKEYLAEFEDADELCREAEKKLLLAIKNFRTNKQFRPFHIKGSLSKSLIEKSFSLNLPCRVIGKIDLAFKDRNGVTIVDWKLGRSDGFGDDSLQLAVYGLWAIEHFGCHPDQLTVYKAHLSSNELVPFRADENALHEAKLLILQDVERMVYWHEYGSDGVVDAFSRCDKPKVCRACIYEEVCYGC